MIGIFGNLLIILNIVLTVLIIFLAFGTLKSINQKNIKIVNNLILLQLTTTIVSFLTLVSAFVLTDLSLVTVYNKSCILDTGIQNCSTQIDEASEIGQELKLAILKKAAIYKTKQIKKEADEFNKNRKPVNMDREGKD